MLVEGKGLVANNDPAYRIMNRIIEIQYYGATVTADACRINGGSYPLRDRIDRDTSMSSIVDPICRNVRRNIREDLC